jgi:hypothetical protein
MCYYDLVRPSLGAFTKFRTATISLVVSVYPSICPHRTRLPLDGFPRNLLWETSSTMCPANSNLIKSRTRIRGTLREDLSKFMKASRSVLLRMRNVSDESCRESQNTYFVFSNFFFLKIVPLWDSMGKYGTAGQARDNKIWYSGAG